MDNYIHRAFSAYYKYKVEKHPLLEKSYVKTLDNKNYIVLKNENELLAVFRITNQGILKRLKRLPQNIE